jgi:hypothetical protein
MTTNTYHKHIQDDDKLTDTYRTITNTNHKLIQVDDKHISQTHIG